MERGRRQKIEQQPAPKAEDPLLNLDDHPQFEEYWQQHLAQRFHKLREAAERENRPGPKQKAIDAVNSMHLFAGRALLRVLHAAENGDKPVRMVFSSASLKDMQLMFGPLLSTLKEVVGTKGQKLECVFACDPEEHDAKLNNFFDTLPEDEQPLKEVFVKPSDDSLPPLKRIQWQNVPGDETRTKLNTKIGILLQHALQEPDRYTFIVEQSKRDGIAARGKGNPMTVGVLAYPESMYSRSLYKNMQTPSSPARPKKSRRAKREKEKISWKTEPFLRGNPEIGSLKKKIQQLFQPYLALVDRDIGGDRSPEDIETLKEAMHAFLQSERECIENVLNSGIWNNNTGVEVERVLLDEQLLFHRIDDENGNTEMRPRFGLPLLLQLIRKKYPNKKLHIFSSDLPTLPTEALEHLNGIEAQHFCFGNVSDDFTQQVKNVLQKNRLHDTRSESKIDGTCALLINRALVYGDHPSRFGLVSGKVFTNRYVLPVAGTNERRRPMFSHFVPDAIPTYSPADYALQRALEYMHQIAQQEK